MSESAALEVQPTPPPPEYIEQNVSMVQQYATARIQTAYLVADKRPRNLEIVRQNVLRECKRPSFCAPDETKSGSSLAIYRVPRGSVKNEETGKWENNYIQGPTIRFAEMFLREYGNLSVEVHPLGEDDKQRILQVILTDYQSRNWTSEIVTVPKTVERKKAKAGDEVLGQRTNSYGDPIYLVKATDDELAMRTNALISKARRNLILQAVPGWLIEEAIDQIRATARAKDAEDPDAAKRKLYDAFATVGVSAQQLTEYLGHANTLSPAELEDLRGYFSGIREGFTTWAAIMAAKEENADDGSAAKIEEILEKLEYPPARARNIKGKYAGNAAKLLEYLQGELGKKEATGAKPADPTPTAASSENLDAEPAPEPAKPPQEAKKPSPAAKPRPHAPPSPNVW